MKLVTPAAAFTPECDAALRAVYDRLDEDMDGALGRNELNEFLLHTEGTELDEAVRALPCDVCGETCCGCKDTNTCTCPYMCGSACGRVRVCVSARVSE